MDLLISDLRCLWRTLLAKTKTKTGMDLFIDTSRDMNRFLDQRLSESHTSNLYQSKQNRDVILDCISAQSRLREVHRNGDYKEISDVEMKTVMDLMTFLLTFAKSRKSQKRSLSGVVCFYVLFNSSIFLLWSNKGQDYETWMKTHMSDLQTLRNEHGDTFLHAAADRHCSRIVKLLVEDGRMKVNVVNYIRETPLHLFCGELPSPLPSGWIPTPGMERIVELLINNGAHIDAADSSGNEVSGVLARAFPRWSFNVNLKCLAVKAIVKHGVRYEELMPTQMISFIETHKAENQGKKLKKTNLSHIL